MDINPKASESNVEILLENEKNAMNKLIDLLWGVYIDLGETPVDLGELHKATSEISIIFKGKSIEDLLYHHSHPFNEDGFYSVSVLAKRHPNPAEMLKELNYVINSISKNSLFDEKTVESYKRPIQKVIDFYDSLLQKDMHV